MFAITMWKSAYKKNVFGFNATNEIAYNIYFILSFNIDNV